MPRLPLSKSFRGHVLSWFMRHQERLREGKNIICAADYGSGGILRYRENDKKLLDDG